ncbi:MAG TPA: delta-aminolevulinic acid dehydratase [Candidatus Bathyarchaeia archaeon]|nr:delta-aminolevulinic acid dehydratase [Candidatus Bathyarchaeia archaeon]
MSKPFMNVALVCGPNCDMETQAIRSTLEYFGARVFTYWIGRPNDFISVLSGQDIYNGTDMIILNFHGDEGKFLMPELGADVYEESEPREDFGPDEILRYAKLNGKTVVSNGCSLGEETLARAFLDCGCKIYMGPKEYPDGNDALMFLIRFFYEIIQHAKSVEEAFMIARSMSDDLSMYEIYVSQAGTTSSE